jgi:hypothetical protein
VVQRAGLATEIVGVPSTRVRSAQSPAVDRGFARTNKWFEAAGDV